MIKAICGYREDQEIPIPKEESHKAYYVFLNQGSRAVFSNGFTIRHEELQRIVPDYHSIMGWNRGHKLDADDYADLKLRGVEDEVKKLMDKASGVAKIASIGDLNKNLSEFKELSSGV